jgi:hypothetical protein
MHPMRNMFGGPVANAAIILSLAAVGAIGQTARIPRMPDGHPNLNGIWQTMNTADWNLEAHAAGPSLVVEAGAEGAEPGGLSVVEGGTIPYLPAALEKRKQNNENRLAADPEVKCYLPGVPRATYLPYPFQIFQSNSAITVAYEFDSAFRNLYLKDPGPAPADSWMGQSYAHWDKDTLVVEVTGLDERTWFDRAGDYHSDDLKVVERYTPVNGSLINYSATITDPKVFSKPWTISMPLYKHEEKNAQLLEFKCVEFVEDLMYGKYKKEPKK